MIPLELLGMMKQNLGLPISKKITEMMNGKIEIKSKIGDGTTFTITIPKTIKEKK